MKRSLQDWLAWQEKLHLSEIDLGLTRIREVADNLDLLAPDFPIITVAGTNGKGSTVAILDAILRAQGYKVGNFTSPHLLEYNERIKIDGENVSDEQIISAFEKIDSARKKTSLTYFEFGTLAAMQCFYDENIEVAILEVGLGGRLDAANLWDTSLALITSIAVDHVDWLGDDREVIGVEKSGIMRKNAPVVCGDPKPPKSIESEAKRIGANILQLNKDFSYKPDTKQKSWSFVINDMSNKSHKTILNLPKPNLSGQFQLNNAATAIAGLKLISGLLPVSQKSIESGLSTVTVLGRLQVINQKPQWLVDVAHNPHSAKALAEHLNSESIKGKTIAIFSMLKDKDIEQVLSLLNNNIDEWHIVALEGSRGITLEDLESKIMQLAITGKVISHGSFEDAYLSLKKYAKSEDRVVAFGSFLVVSHILILNGVSRHHG